ncbi:hypothetical protein [Fischerella sp. PCC 9605]|uniref:hypothetical protein n=1 Tax=Fischerella sp. PCC 9605 TaxID=1173024 RepID=UPI0004B21F0F|nr:hypothetical protein [Fischerella sp. PCC 9605]
MIMIQGRLEITIKINELPQAKTVENGWQQFDIECDGRIITTTVKPKVWKKLTDAQANYPQWVGAIALHQVHLHALALAAPKLF